MPLIVLQTDASGIGIEATLSHRDIHVGFFSRTWQNSKMAYSDNEREAMAILEGLRRFWDLLRTQGVLFRSNKKALSHF